MAQRISIEEIGGTCTHIYTVNHDSEKLVSELVRRPARGDLNLVAKFTVTPTEILNALPERVSLRELEVCDLKRDFLRTSPC